MTALALLALVALAPEPGGPNAKYLQPDLDVQAWVQRFEKPGREVFDRRKEIVAAVGVKPGTAVADVGAGTGLFTMLLAQAVGPGGKVYAVDIAKPFLAHIAKRAKAAGVKNVETVQATDRTTSLSTGSVELLFVCDTYHHFENPQVMLADFRRALRPGGTLVIVDYHREPGKSPAWITDHVRAGRAAVIKEIEAAGFVREPDPLPSLKENYLLRFRR
jgi:ubiquinone/menaquinone biosynthesis C-methylase UbiE